jgi:hypothetical protein
MAKTHNLSASVFLFVISAVSWSVYYDPYSCLWSIFAVQSIGRKLIEITKAFVFKSKAAFSGDSFNKFLLVNQ